ncbi:MAG: hypothetical protein ACJAV9_000131, partial [Urechidicola sp.]
GFKYEPWHYSYTSTSSKMLNEFLKISLKEMLLEEEIVGSKNFTQEFLNQYLINNVLDINPDLK